MSKNLTENQLKFLEALFGPAKGNYVKAKQIAGYADTVATSQVVEPLRDEIALRTRNFISENGPKAVWAMMDIMDNPTDLGSKEKMAVAKDFLDRAGFKASDKVEVTSNSPLFILPEKKAKDT
jgi:hypothetical protein